MTVACAPDTILVAASEVDERLLECLASCRATFVRTFEDAQRALREQLFRLIVIDLNFDNVRMFDLLQHVRSLARFNGVPVLCIQGADGGAGITAALDRVVRTLGGLVFLDLRGNAPAPASALQRLRQIVGAELGIGLPQPWWTKPEREDLALLEAKLPARRLCILIIDHDVDSAHRLGELLEQLGHDVDLAYDGSAGLDAARRLRPDAVFVGLAQPSGTGYRLARRLRRECNQDNVLLVAVASALSEEGCLRMREAGFDEQLLKSADREAVARLLSRRASRPAPGTTAGRR